MGGKECMIDVRYRYETSQHEELLTKSFRVQDKCNYKVYNNIYAIPKTQKGTAGGLYDENGNLIHETSLNKDSGCMCVDLKSREEYEELSFPCIYLGVYENTWGHFITDCLKKIWIIVNDKENQFQDYKLIFVSKKASALGNNHRRLLELLGVNVSNINLITKDTLVKQIIVPDSCFFYSEESLGIPFSTFIHYSDEYADIINKLKQQYTDTGDGSYEKIYYSYSRYKKHKRYRKTFGEEKLDKFFKDQGYRIVHPEDYSLDEQLQMLANCKYYASTEGSVSHNSVFLNDGCQIIIIPRGPYFSGYQQCIDTIGNHDIYYIDASLSALTSKSGPWSGPNYYYVSEELMSFFGLSEEEKQKYRKNNFCDMNAYLKYCLVNLGGRAYYANNVYTEKFLYYLGLNHRKVFPIYSLINYLCDGIASVWRKITRKN